MLDFTDSEILPVYEFRPRLLDMDFAELRKVIDQIELVDAHAHNIVNVDSTFPFISCFSEAQGDALPLSLHSLSFKVQLKASSLNQLVVFKCVSLAGC